MILPRASLKRSLPTRTRKATTDMDVAGPSPPSSVLVRPKTRPPPLQIIPELSENELVVDISLATARPTHFIPQQPVSSRITLSAYAFSIDDALLMFGGDTPGSPALSASSSTSDGTSSEDVPATPVTSDDDGGYDFALPTPRLQPQHISTRPPCITKTRFLICHDEDIHFEKEEKVVPLPVTDGVPQHFTEAEAATEAAVEADQDFYTHEFEDFISLFSAMPPLTGPARRDSVVLVAEPLPAVVETLEPKSRGRSRHSKPLPLLPPLTPPISTFRSIPNVPLVQVVAQNSVVRQKRNIAPLSNRPSLPPPRPLPRMGLPLDIEDCAFPEEVLDASLCGSTVSTHAYDIDKLASIYSQPSFTYAHSAGARTLPSAIPETPLCGMNGEVTLPRSSTDSDAPRSSVDSASSFASSASSNSPSSSSFPSSPSEERLRSRWSTSTLGSLVIEPPRSTTLLSPLRSFGSKARRIIPPPKMPSHLTPSKLSKSKRSFSVTSSAPSASGKYIRRQESRLSTSSAETSSSERNSRDGSRSGLKKKPIPVTMFLRAT